MKGNTVLLVDDEPDILQLLEITLARMNLNTRRAETLQAAKRSLAEFTPDLCLTDMKLPDGNGLSLIQHIQDHYPELPVAMLTAHGNVETAIDALKLGAFDFVTKPLALEKLRELVGHALDIHKGGNGSSDQTLIGDTPPINQLRIQIKKVARSQAPVHINGESGVGKEVVARLIHQLGPRASRPFIAVNCGAIPPDLVESELFGHRKGAFTGATADKQGLFQAAAGGTLFLDEIADLPFPTQVKLLRVIQEKSVRPVGSEKEIAADVRLLSATHKSLALEAQEGRFRDDLYYRINVIGLQVPTLRERKADIPLLARYLLARQQSDNRNVSLAISDEAMDALIQHDFPGNIRELDNILARAQALADGDTIEAGDLSFETRVESNLPDADVNLRGSSNPKEMTPREGSNSDDPDLLMDVDGDIEGYIEQVEKRILNAALLKHRWNKTATAKALGLSFRSLRYRLKKLGIDD